MAAKKSAAKKTAKRTAKPMGVMVKAVKYAIKRADMVRDAKAMVAGGIESRAFFVEELGAWVSVSVVKKSPRWLKGLPAITEAELGAR